METFALTNAFFSVKVGFMSGSVPEICDDKELDICMYRAGIFKKSMGARHRVGIGLLYRPTRLHRLAEFIPWNRFRGPIHVQKYQLCTRTLQYTFLLHHCTWWQRLPLTGMTGSGGNCPKLIFWTIL